MDKSPLVGGVSLLKHNIRTCLHQDIPGFLSAFKEVLHSYSVQFSVFHFASFTTHIVFAQL